MVHDRSISEFKLNFFFYESCTDEAVSRRKVASGRRVPSAIGPWLMLEICNLCETLLVPVLIYRSQMIWKEEVRD